MLDTLCTLPLRAELFALAVHPKLPLCTVGLQSGRVQTYRLPDVAEEGDASVVSNASEKSNGTSQIETVWGTRRHMGSCRSLSYSYDGEQVFSAGTDGLVKCAWTETGWVEWKIAIPEDPSIDDMDDPAIIHALTPQTLLVGTDSSALHLYDLRIPRKTSLASMAVPPQATFHPHEDFIASLTPLPPSESSTSGLPKQWITTGGTTLAVTDLRRGVLVRSEDQEELLVSSCLVTGLGSRGSSTGAKAVVGCGDGVLTLWERGVWDDQDERITVDRRQGGGDSLECIVQVPEELGLGKAVAVGTGGMGGGLVRFVQLGQNRVVGECSHDEMEGVVAVDFDVGGRMITGGGQIIKVWDEKVRQDDEAEQEEAETNGAGKHGRDDSEEEDDEDDEDSDDEKPHKKRKKRKRNKGKHLNAKQSQFSFGGLD